LSTEWYESGVGKDANGVDGDSILDCDIFDLESERHPIQEVSRHLCPDEIAARKESAAAHSLEY
jgi:hypothetical protein